MNCNELAELMPAYAGEGDMPLSVRRHVSRCPECREELAQYNALRATFVGLRSVTDEPPPGLLADLTEIPAHRRGVGDVRAHVVRNRNAYLGGAAVALAGVAGATLVRRRRNPATA